MFKPFKHLLIVIAFLRTSITQGFRAISGRNKDQILTDGDLFFVGDIHHLGDVTADYMLNGDPNDSIARITSEFIGYPEGDAEGDIVPAMDGAPAGDPDGDVDGDIDGDPDGDLYEGAPRRRKKFTPLKKIKAKRIKRRMQADARKAAKSESSKRVMEGKILSGDKFAFISSKNFRVQNVIEIPIDSTFKAPRLRQALERSALLTPYSAIIASASGAPLTATTAVGAGATTFYNYPVIVLKIGASALNSVPNNVITVVVTIPLEKGTNMTLTIEGQLTAIADATIEIFPFQTVQGKPVPTYGRVGGAAAHEVVAVFTGVPNGTAATIILPLSEHPLFQKLEAVTTPYPSNR